MYVHLGSVVSYDGGKGPEVAQRAASANAAACELCKGTLGRKDIDFHVKLTAAVALLEPGSY